MLFSIDLKTKHQKCYFYINQMNLFISVNSLFLKENLGQHEIIKKYLTILPKFWHLKIPFPCLEWTHHQRTNFSLFRSQTCQQQAPVYHFYLDVLVSWRIGLPLISYFLMEMFLAPREDSWASNCFKINSIFGWILGCQVHTVKEKKIP